MDHKAWLWRKKSSEKTIVGTDKLDLSLKGNEEEVQILSNDKAELENDVKNLSSELSSALAECNAKDNLVKEHAKMAQEAIAGWKKAEAELVSLKKELVEALQQRVTDEERLIHLDAALKECMEQLHFVREEQGQRIHDAVMKASREFEKSQMILEEKLADSSKRLANLGVENTQVTQALLEKETLIEDLSKERMQGEADFIALTARLDSTEKENASLKYEVRVLEKELEIRNEEREFNRRTADALHKQHLESVKKIAKLESECQRLRVLVRKRLPGPAALAKMRNEVEMLGRESTETRRTRLNSSPFGSMADSAVNDSPDSSSKRINFLTEQLCALEEENKNFKEVLNRKTNELQFSRTMYARAASKLSEVESQLEELSKGHKIMEPTRTSVMSYELSQASMSDIGSDDKVSCAESHASALISELEHLRIAKQRESSPCKTVGASDISLMDDFVEMEKLAIVSVDEPSAKGANAIVVPVVTESSRNSWNSSDVTSRVLVQAPDHQSDFGVLNQYIKSGDILSGKFPGWLQDTLELILEQNRISQRSPHEILEDVRIALTCIDHPTTVELIHARESSNNPDTSNSHHVNCTRDADIRLSEKTNQQFLPDLSKSICKIAELIERINLLSPDNGVIEMLSKKEGRFLSYKNSETSTGYMVRVFQWKTSELSGVLQQFVDTCYDVLNKKADFNKFAEELSISMEWIVNHCFSLQDVSSMKDAIKKHFDWDESRSEGEAEIGMLGQCAEADRLHLPRGQSSHMPTVSLSNGHVNFSQKEEPQSKVREENRKLINESISVEAAKQVGEESLQSVTDKSESLMNQLHESEKIISNLQNELETLRQSKEMVEDQVKNHKLMNEDLDTQLNGTRVELNEARQIFASLEVKLEDKNSSCEELEAKCLALQLKLESLTKNENPTNGLEKDGKKIRTDWEITAASEKLAECQETMLNLGKQLKALASPTEAALFDKVISTPTAAINNTTATTTVPTPTPTPSLPKNKIVNQRSSLLDQMIAEDNAEGKDLNSPKTNGSDGDYHSLFIPNGSIEPLEKILINAVDNSLAIVPSKKGSGGNLWKKLLWRRQKNSSKKMNLPFAA